MSETSNDDTVSVASYQDDWRLTCMLCGTREGLILVPQMAGASNDMLIGYLAVCSKCRGFFGGADIVPRLITPDEVPDEA